MFGPKLIQFGLLLLFFFKKLCEIFRRMFLARTDSRSSCCAIATNTRSGMEQTTRFIVIWCHLLLFLLLGGRSVARIEMNNVVKCTESAVTQLTSTTRHCGSCGGSCCCHWQRWWSSFTLIRRHWRFCWSCDAYDLHFLLSSTRSPALFRLWIVNGHQLSVSCFI